MTGSPSLLQNWIDSDFWNNGAFLVSSDGEHVTFAKGGSTTQTGKFFETASPVFYLKDFYRKEYLAYSPASFLVVSKANALIWIRGLSEDHQHISPVSNDDDIYEKDFSALKAAFKHDLEKVVLISRETYVPFEKEKSIRKLIRKAFEFGTGTPYGFWNHHYGVIGSTPETLYSVEDGNLMTFALAGTARLGQEEELLNSKKDRHEHDLVIRDISEKLKAFTEMMNISETGIHPFRNIIHLKTNIVAALKSDIDFSELTNTLSPTAALGGYPQEKALLFLKSTSYSQKYPMRWFGSAFGLVSDDYKHFVVSIRNVQWEDQHLFIESGGGVVQESDLLKEIEEIRLKRETIRKHYL